MMITTTSEGSGGRPGSPMAQIDEAGDEPATVASVSGVDLEIQIAGTCSTEREAQDVLLVRQCGLLAG
jgi:hypothetical protein